MALENQLAHALCKMNSCCACEQNGFSFFFISKSTFSERNSQSKMWRYVTITLYTTYLFDC